MLQSVCQQSAFSSTYAAVSKRELTIAVYPFIVKVNVLEVC